MRRVNQFGNAPDGKRGKVERTWQWILRNIVPILAAIITVGGTIFVYTYFKPRVEYEQGAFYRSGIVPSRP